ncbi:type II secretion system protein GspL [Sphingomonas jatrophae]|uniref:Type II secretion system protein L (GspL) n=1 Tax=Sphingomonas jatrophae TaxID=1166337 RepID=A0A1I6JD81_9SPHN|nr:type II secretion system protein GspL [Sphingomonas jatrophae]SFR76926.1 type II secretion system protein L (GspL) [Sphingomonas jatrophae]
MTLLVWPATGDSAAAWWRLGEEGRIARGHDLADVAAMPGERVVLVAPGSAVALHWIELPALAPNQARAAARLAAAEIVAAPLDTLHVAVAAGGEGLRPMAVVEAGLMAGWLAQAAAAGLEPDHVVPEPLLLPLPDEEPAELHWPRDGRVVVRGMTSGHVAEPELAALLAEGSVRLLDDDAVADGLALRLDPPALDLRQGAFARRWRLGVDWRLARRLAGLVGLILLVTLAIQLVRIARYEAAAIGAETRAEAAARSALPRATRIVDPAAQLDRRLADLRGGGLGFSTMAVLLSAAVRDTGGVELTALAFDDDGRLTATVAAPGTVEVDALVARLAAAGLDARASAPRPGGDRPLADLTVTVR